MVKHGDVTEDPAAQTNSRPDPSQWDLPASQNNGQNRSDQQPIHPAGRQHHGSQTFGVAMDHVEAQRQGYHQARRAQRYDPALRQQPDNQWPNQIELLLYRQTPEMSEYADRLVRAVVPKDRPILRVDIVGNPHSLRRHHGVP